MNSEHRRCLAFAPQATPVHEAERRPRDPARVGVKTVKPLDR